MEGLKRKKAMWLYPKVVGFNPPERWGHSACYFDGSVFVFGGCCGGLHFSDVLTLNLETMIWNSLVTTGMKPGTRDSHSATLLGQKMIVFGGTNGSKKVNDLHILDLRTREWTKPNCKGTPPLPRESHTATVIGDEKLVVFGGSGEGESNYLNDIYVLDLKSMVWNSPEVRGDVPAPRDSHTAVAIGNKLYIYGGDCGDRYHGEVDVLNMDSLTWSKLVVQGPSPGVRAGHAAVFFGSKVYIIGGVGDKQYYSDVWVLDAANCLWTQLDICGQTPQGRFAHTAVVTNTDIAIYGGCGEDERPLNELIILQLGSEHPNGRYNIAMCKIFGSHWSQEKRKFLRTENTRERKLGLVEMEPRISHLRGLDNIHAKRRRTFNEIDTAEQEEHSLTISQHSSPSQSDQELNNNIKKLSTSPNGSARSALSGSQPFIPFKLNQEKEQINGLKRSTQDLTFLSSESPRNCLKFQDLSTDQKPLHRPTGPHFIGAEVHGTVDAAFDSGYLMTAVVNGQIFRGVLFAPGPGVTAPRPVIHPQILSGSTVTPHHHRLVPPNAIPVHVSRPTPNCTTAVLPNWGHQFSRQSNLSQVVKVKPERINSDLQDVVLTLGGPGAGRN